MPTRPSGTDGDGGGGGVPGGGIRLRSPSSTASDKLGTKGFHRYDGGIVPTVSVDLCTTEFASKLRSECHFSATGENVNPTGDFVLCDTDSLPAGGYSVAVCIGGSAPNVQRFERVSEGGGVMEMIMLRCGGSPTQGVATTFYFSMIADEGDIFRLVANVAVTATVDSAIVALRNW